MNQALRVDQSRPRDPGRIEASFEPEPDGRIPMERKSSPSPVCRSCGSCASLIGWRRLPSRRRLGMPLGGYGGVAASAR